MPKAVVTHQSSTAKQAAESGTVNIALGKQREHLQSLRDRGIVVDEDTEQHQAEVRKICRDYVKYHDLIPMILTVYSRFPLQGMRIDCQDEKQQEAFEHQFFDVLNYKEFLAEVGMEYFTCGEVTVFGIYDDVMKQWVSEEILNPDNVHSGGR